VYSVH